MMDKFVYIRLFADLDFFVATRFKGKTIRLKLFGNPSVKDVIESVGVPHTEFELVTINGEPAETDQNVHENDHLVVYPHFYHLPVEKCPENKFVEISVFRFILDVHLGKLAALLRLLGFDSVYNNQLDDDEIIDIAFNENRIILSRDLGIFKNSRVRKGYFPRSQDPKVQLKEVIDRYDLRTYFNPFSRCINCNGELVPVEKEMIKDELKEKTRLFYHDFYSCVHCRKNYWKGSHYNKMKEFVEFFSKN